MTLFSFGLLALSTLAFIAAASSAKMWALSADSWLWLALTLALYTLGNLVMLKLIRDVGMSVALSLSAVVQLLAVNIVALALFGERLTAQQLGGIGLGLLTVVLLTFGR